jgi:hypothetical protein
VRIDSRIVRINEKGYEMSQREIKLCCVNGTTYIVEDLTTGDAIGIIKYNKRKSGWKGHWLICPQEQIVDYHSTLHDASGAFGVRIMDRKG